MQDWGTLLHEWLSEQMPRDPTTTAFGPRGDQVYPERPLAAWRLVVTKRLSTTPEPLRRLRSTPAAALEREAVLMPFAVRRRQLVAAAVQRHLRDLPGDPLQPLLQAGRSRRRLPRDRGWAETGLEVCAGAGL